MEWPPDASEKDFIQTVLKKIEENQGCLDKGFLGTPVLQGTLYVRLPLYFRQWNIPGYRNRKYTTKYHLHKTDKENRTWQAT